MAIIVAASSLFFCSSGECLKILKFIRLFYSCNKHFHNVINYAFQHINYAQIMFFFMFNQLMPA